MRKEILQELFEKYIKGTPEKAVVADRKVFLCRLTYAVSNGLNIGESVRGVYVTSRCLKHLFDKKPAEEFLFLLDNLPYRNFKIPRHSESRLRAMTPKILVLWRDEESPGARDGQGIAR